ncbi:MAG: MFS transporter [Patescibacteria group bacterium]|nr:MFS transporter [Patescibacteria group bacterium]
MFKSINKIIKILILSDFFAVSAWGLIAPILAIFIVENIHGGDAKVAGIAVGIYWVAKSIFQIPIGRYLDRNHGEKDDYYFLIIGTFIAAVVPIGFIFARYPWHLYFWQLVHAIAWAMAIPAWGGIFTRHIDKGKEAFSWGLESSSIGLGAGIAGIIGGIVAKFFGFIPLFLGVSILTIIAGIVLFLISQNLLPKEKIILIPKPK